MSQPSAPLVDGPGAPPYGQGPPAYGQPGYGQPGYGQPGYGQQPGGPQPSKPKSRKTLMIVLASIVALALIVGGVLFALDAQAKKKAAEAARLAEEQRTAALADASAPVKGYLEALAAGDAEKALGFGPADTPTDKALLTNDVLAASNQQGAVTDITVSPITVEKSGDEYTSGSVQAVWKIGDKPAQHTFQVDKRGGQWKLDRITGQITIEAGPSRKVNGVEIPEGPHPAFPGTYRIESASPLFEVLSGADLAVVTPNDNQTPKPLLKLSPQGEKETTDAAKAALDECLKKQELSPEGCPMLGWHEANGIKVNNSTIKLRLTNDPWSGLRWTYGSETRTASATMVTKVQLNASATQNGRAGTVQDEKTATVGIRAKYDSGKPEVTFR